jgi:Zn-finger nucleic acid-binding protein
MQCPKCRSVMRGVEHAGITVDRCTACGGLWFDGMEHVELKRAGGGAVVDAGRAAGSTQDVTTPAPVPCPVCAAPLETRFDAYQHHLHYETCPHGHGVYFDAGEFRDFVTDDWSDFFKGLFSHYPGK